MFNSEGLRLEAVAVIPGYAPDMQALVNMLDAVAADELCAMCARRAVEATDDVLK